jgi:hypothetical protein
MFLKRMLAPVRKSLFGRNAPTQDSTAETCIILKRVRELMEMPPAVPAAAPSAANADGGVERTNN